MFRFEKDRWAMICATDTFQIARDRIAANPDMSNAIVTYRQVRDEVRHTGRRKAALVDMDGTLCDISTIRHHVRVAPGVEKDFDAFHQASRQCPPHPQALDFCRRHHDMGHVIVVVTARMERHYDVSRAWLDEWMPVPFDGPIMREDGLRYSDVVIKRRIYNYLARHYDIVAACDDRPEICDLWVELGVPEVEVVPGWEM